MELYCTFEVIFSLVHACDIIRVGYVLWYIYIANCCCCFQSLVSTVYVHCDLAGASYIKFTLTFIIA